MDILRDTQPQGTHRVAFLDWGWLKKHAASAIPSVTSTCKVRGEGREEPVPVCVSYVNGSCCCYCTVDPDTPTPLLFPRTHTHNTHTHTPSFLSTKHSSPQKHAKAPGCMQRQRHRTYLLRPRLLVLWEAIRFVFNLVLSMSKYFTNLIILLNDYNFSWCRWIVGFGNAALRAKQRWLFVHAHRSTGWVQQR